MGWPPMQIIATITDLKVHCLIYNNMINKLINNIAPIILIGIALIIE